LGDDGNKFVGDYVFQSIIGKNLRGRPIQNLELSMRAKRGVSSAPKTRRISQTYKVSNGGRKERVCDMQKLG